MRFSSFFALGALLAPVLAAPVADNFSNSDINLVNVELEDLVHDVSLINAAPVKRTVIEKPEQVVETCEGLLVSIKVHTAIINETVKAVPEGTKCSDEQLATIKVQLNVIVDLIKTVTIALGAVKGVLKFADAEVTKIVSLVVAIVLEVVCTLIFIIKSLDIKVLLTLILSNLCSVIAGLILVLDKIVGGVLVLVLGCLNVPAILGLVSCVLGNLIIFLTTGKLSISL
jgi:hypothetical protein